MDKQVLLDEISSFCRQAGMAESTFGRRAVNDGKLITRLRFGGRVTTETLDRVRAFMSQPLVPRPQSIAPRARHGANGHTAPAPTAADTDAAVKGFRFYDNRQKYLSFVTTCGEKWAVADRVSEELANIHPRPPALRVFDAGVGEGTVLTRVMRSMHARFPTMPFYIVGKEISLEDIRLVLEKMADRFYEHPATVLVLTNMYYAEAPWLQPRSVTAATSMVWHEERLRGTTSRDFEEQITRLQPFLSENWTARVSQTSGNPVYQKPVVLVLYRDDYRFLLDHVRPRRGVSAADYDLVLASQPYRARASAEFKAQKVLAPLARSLAPGGRLIGIHSHGDDPGLEIVRKVWPGENPFITDRHTLLRATKAVLGPDSRDLNFNSYADARALFRYGMHTLPTEISATIGTSTLFAAWNAAIYVAQIEDERLSEAVVSGRWLEATSEVLREHRGLWFWDESYVISRKRDGSDMANDAERAAVMALVSGASLEMLPRERDAIVPAAEFLVPGTEVYVSSPPAVSHHDIVSALVALRRRGFEPVPHVAARSLVGFTQLNDLLARAAGEAGVRRALVIGGDLDTPSGPFHSSFDVLTPGLFEKYGFVRIGLAAYPEGHPRIAEATLNRALAVKLALLRQNGIEAQAVTQFAFDAAPMLAWLQGMHRREPLLPVRVGLAGPASIATLARYAVRCGIGHSIGTLVRHGTAIARLVTESGPEPVVRQLAAANWREMGVNGIHLFSFGGLTRTASWLRAVADGDFRVEEGGAGFAVKG